MIEIQGNFWDVSDDYDAICCTINTVVKNDGSLVMGAGIAKSFNDKYPPLAKQWGKRIIYNKKEPYVLVSMNIEVAQYLIGIPTKIHYKDKSTIELISKSMSELLSIKRHLGLRSILMTRPGCGLGGLNWKKDVKPILVDMLDDRFTIIHNGDN